MISRNSQARCFRTWWAVRSKFYRKVRGDALRKEVTVDFWVCQWVEAILQYLGNGEGGGSQCGPCLGSQVETGRTNLWDLLQKKALLFPTSAPSGTWSHLYKDVNCSITCICKSLSIHGVLAVEYYTAVKKNETDVFWYEHYITEWKMKGTEQGA